RPTSARECHRRAWGGGQPTAAATPPASCTRRPSSRVAKTDRSGDRGKYPRRRLIFGQGRGAGDQALELVQSQVADRLEDLLVAPADLPCLLVQVERWGTVGL